MPKSYPEETRQYALRRLLVDKCPLSAVSRELQVSEPVLRKWRSEYLEEHPEEDPKSNDKVSLTEEEKFHHVLKSEGLSEEELGAYARQNGLYLANLEEWRSRCLTSLRDRPLAEAKKPESSENTELKRKYKEVVAQLKAANETIDERNKVIAELNTVILLQKKISVGVRNTA